MLKKKIFWLVVLTLIIFVVVIIYQDHKEPETDLVVFASSKEEKEEIEIKYIKVYLEGAFNLTKEVVVPYDYKIKDLIRIYGLKKDADLSKVDIEASISENQRIRIPFIDEEEEEVENKNKDLININKATKEELMKLPGIGSYLASLIIEYRENEAFKTIQDIMKVRGIKEEKYNDIKDKITVE